MHDWVCLSSHKDKMKTLLYDPKTIFMEISCRWFSTKSILAAHGRFITVKCESTANGIRNKQNVLLFVPHNSFLTNLFQDLKSLDQFRSWVKTKVIEKNFITPFKKSDWEGVKDSN